jgi:hypothetical protein
MHVGHIYNEFSDEYFDDPDFELSLYEEGLIYNQLNRKCIRLPVSEGNTETIDSAVCRQ